MKELEGKEVFLVPTGNNVRRGDGSRQYLKGYIVKVAKVNCTFIVGGPKGREQVHKYSGNILDSGFNSGYKVYATEQEILDIYELSALAKRIYERTKYPHLLEAFGIEKLRKIAAILDE